MRVLVACEFSGTVRDAFLEAGHDAWSCDLLESETQGPHVVGDALEVVARGGWDILIAHPPCTYLANSGVRWLHERPDRWAKMEDGARFFRALLEAPVDRVAVENPVMHRYGLELIGARPAQTVQPWQFGDDASKRTALWLRGLPPLLPTEIVGGRIVDGRHRYANQTDSGQNRLPPSDDRAHERSRFFPGIARAMADQWGTLPNAEGHA